jgi:surfeit locus 1 family protein
VRAPFLRHRPRLRFLLVTVAAIAGMALAAALARWQLDRAAQKEALHDAIARRGAMPPLDAAALQRRIGPAIDRPDGAGDASAASAPLLHRAVRLRGRWLAARTVYLDNRPMDGRVGFYVVTPLQLDAGSGDAASPDAPPAVVLVQRGWIPRDFADRVRLRPVETPAGPVEVEGRIAASPSRLLSLGTAQGSAPQGDSPIRQNLDLAGFRRETGLPLLAASVVQTAPRASEGLLRAWPEIASGVEKHYGYAFQWFGLCALIAILYVWYQIIRRFVRPRQPPAPG